MVIKKLYFYISETFCPCKLVVLWWNGLVLNTSSHLLPAPPAAPLLLPVDFPSHPVSAPAGPGRRFPAPGMKAAHTSTPTPPIQQTHTHSLVIMSREYFTQT